MPEIDNYNTQSLDLTALLPGRFVAPIGDTAVFPGLTPAFTFNEAFHDFPQLDIALVEKGHKKQKNVYFANVDSNHPRSNVPQSSTNAMLRLKLLA